MLPPVQPGGADLGAIARSYVADLRAELYEQHRAGAGGTAIVEAYTDGIDRLIAFLFDSATAEYTERYVLLDHRCTVAAQGGYGRFELNPSSDIDLLVLYPWRVNAYVETVAERILYSLWDAGLVVGHASRTVADCTRLAQRDLKVKTALLDARFLAGDRPLYAEFEAAMESDVLKKNAARFYREKLAESSDRHRRYGDSVYLLEPELKEGAGGLRDIHTAMWLAKIKYKVKDMRELVVKGVISERERAEIEASQDFLFRVRNALHFLTGTHQDHLTFDLQDRAAPELGFGDDGTNRPVERLMKTYFTHATAIRRFSDTIIERCTERPTPYRLIGRVIGREIRAGVWIINRTLSVDGAEVIRENPTLLVTVFRDAQRHSVRITQGTQRLIREHLHLIGEAERHDPAFIRPFLEILAWNHQVWETVQEMHRVGVVCQLFPEFSRIDCLVQRDPNHIYCVDEHSLRGIGELERLRRGEHKQTAPLLTEVMRELDRHEVLFLALLFHDIGKGHGEGHSARGADMVRDIATRLPLHEDDIAQWEFLVRQHLLMSHLAQHRDTHDPRLLDEFSRTCGSIENLKMLYVMTFADMRAVGPKVWNNWRDMLLGELYMRTLTRFEQGQVEEDEHGRAERIRQRLLGLIDPDRQAAFRSFLASMPERYLTTTPEAQVPAHFELMNHLREEWSIRPEDEHPHLFVSTVRHVPESEYSELTICTPDRPGLFAMIAGVLTAQGMNIVGARITTSRGGIAIDTFRIGHQEQLERVLEPERWERVQQMLAKVLRGQVDIAALVAASGRPSILEKPTQASTMPPDIIVDNDISADYTVLDVVTGDRVGVLFAITHALHRLGLIIHLAKITTQAHQVLDVFYVTDGDGRKMLDQERLHTICETISTELLALASHG